MLNRTSLPTLPKLLSLVSAAFAVAVMLLATPGADAHSDLSKRGQPNKGQVVKTQRSRADTKPRPVRVTDETRGLRHAATGIPGHTANYAWSSCENRRPVIRSYPPARVNTFRVNSRIYWRPTVYRWTGYRWVPHTDASGWTVEGPVYTSFLSPTSMSTWDYTHTKFNELDNLVNNTIYTVQEHYEWLSNDWPMAEVNHYQDSYFDGSPTKRYVKFAC